MRPATHHRGNPERGGLAGRGLGRWGPVPQPNQLRDDPTLCDRVIRDLFLHERKATTGPSTTFATQRGGTRPCGFCVPNLLLPVEVSSLSSREHNKQSWFLTICEKTGGVQHLMTDSKNQLLMSRVNVYGGDRKMVLDESYSARLLP
ncbi:hypothetical protein Pelo_6083 [Pelomyxa schiedti]|nr:hypothetical protein Pelo_6083 [Pelomyxa schiedti]